MLRWFVACLIAVLPLTALPLRATPPPQLPDWEAAQLYEGCAIEADSYARHLILQDSSWDVSLAAVVLPNGQKHSVAVARRGGETYVRDSLLGVFPVEGDIQTAFDRRMRHWRNDHPQTSPNASNNHRPPQSEKATAAAVDIVQRTLWTQSHRFLVVEGKKRYWVVAWTTVDGRRALYHPTIGTTLTDAKGGPDTVALKVLRALGCQDATLLGSSQR